jgi:hypothetical protein
VRPAALALVDFFGLAAGIFEAFEIFEAVECFEAAALFLTAGVLSRFAAEWRVVDFASVFLVFFESMGVGLRSFFIVCDRS